MCQRCQKSWILIERNGALKLNAKQQAEPDRNVGITGKIEQYLEAEAERQPGVAVGHQTERRLRVDRVEKTPDPVAEDDLFKQADRDKGGGNAELALPARRIHLATELVHDLRPTRQRTGDRLRKERDVERIAAERIERRLPAP
jgi:hypothetical protein